jgi:hypothetical protein
MEKYIALVNKQTGKVENVVTHPVGRSIYFVGDEYEGVLVEDGSAAIGDTRTNGVFVKPVKAAEDIRQSETKPQKE